MLRLPAMIMILFPYQCCLRDKLSHIKYSKLQTPLIKRDIRSLPKVKFRRGPGLSHVDRVVRFSKRLWRSFLWRYNMYIWNNEVRSLFTSEISVESVNVCCAYGRLWTFGWVTDWLNYITVAIAFRVFDKKWSFWSDDSCWVCVKCWSVSFWAMCSCLCVTLQLWLTDGTWKVKRRCSTVCMLMTATPSRFQLKNDPYFRAVS